MGNVLTVVLVVVVVLALLLLAGAVESGYLKRSLGLSLRLFRYRDRGR